MSTATLRPAHDERLERVLAAIVAPESPGMTYDAQVDAPERMTDRHADREFAIDADFAAATEFG